MSDRHYENDSLKKLIDSLKAAKERPGQQTNNAPGENTGKTDPKKKQEAPGVPPTLPLYKPDAK